MIVDQQKLKDNYVLLLIFFMVIFFVTMISIDNVILFIFITICIFFGVGISAILKIYSRRQQNELESEDPFRSAMIADRQNNNNNNQAIEQNVGEFPNNSIFVIDIGNETFYKEPPPPKYGEEMPPSYDEAIKNARILMQERSSTG